MRKDEMIVPRPELHKGSSHKSPIVLYVFVAMPDTLFALLQHVAPRRRLITNPSSCLKPVNVEQGVRGGVVMGCGGSRNQT
jgi:hypothetical protein